MTDQPAQSSEVTRVSPLGSAATPARLVVLISGSGTNLERLMTVAAQPGAPYTIVGVGADRDSIRGLEIARGAGLPTFVHRVADYPTRDDWDCALTADIAAFHPDLVVSAGFLKILGSRCLAAFDGRILNTHNALLPAFPGIHGPADAWEYGVKVAGATLFVVDAGTDTGVIVAQCVVPIYDDDTVDVLTERIKAAERDQLVEYVERLVREGWTIRGRRLSLGV
ncbi:MAG: phosphoribosylglycinamide formyltransferase [Varibaculum sp.]|nr:phosphoribosylglycinamide formyltransferase [Varibaculum sp.]